MKKTLKIIGIGIVALWLIGKLSHLGDDKSDGYKSSVSTSPQASEPTYETVFAGDLIKVYDDNEVRADGSYKGKNLRVTGNIISIGNDILDHPYVVIAAGKSKYEVTGVQCTFENKSDVARLQKGTSVTILGKCEGKMMNVQMGGCHF